MHDLLHCKFNSMSGWQRLAVAITNVRWRVHERCRRITRAWRYARQALTVDDAQTMMLNCQHPSGWHPLTVLTVESTLQQAYEEFHEHPELPRLIAEGCARVSNKWEDFNDTLYEARRWAIELARTYAAQENIVLARRQHETSDQIGGPHDGA